MTTKKYIPIGGLVLQDMGTWGATVNYAVGNLVVAPSGDTYRCTVPNLNQQPPNVSYWTQYTAQGAPGTPGTPGTPGGVLNWCGLYDPGTTYHLNDGVVSSEGRAFYALGTTTGNAPPAYPTQTNAQWSLFAERGPVDTGWITGPPLTFGAADAPTYTVTCSGDYSAIITPGMRMKMTQAGSVKYFIVTASVYNAPNTTITLYGGTDYTLGATITSPYYSMMKAPPGFPLDPAKWSIVVLDTTGFTQSSPAQNQWYNDSHANINIPLGLWEVSWKGDFGGYISTGGPTYEATLSSANNTIGLAALTAVSNMNDTIAASYPTFIVPGYCYAVLNLAAKATYYCNVRTTGSGVTAIYLNLNLLGVVSAVCAYL